MPRAEVSRESLYELIWTEPMTAVARRFNVSDVAVIKVGKKLKVPRPPRGYWARKQHGYKVPDRPPLKVLEGDEQATTHVFTQPDQGRRVWPKQTTEPSAFPSTVRTHPMLLPLKAKLADARPDRYGRVGVEKNINVSKKMLPRATRILSALFASLEKRGCAVTIVDDRLTVSVRGEQVVIAAYEVAGRVKVGERNDWGYQRLDYQPSGRLVLKANAVDFWQIRREWSDGKSVVLEGRLTEIVRDVEAAPTLIATERAADEARRRRWRREELERRRAEALIVLLRSRATNVARLAADYDRAIQIRSLITGDREQCECAGEVTMPRAMGDHLDPLVAFRIPDLEGEARRDSTSDS